MDEGLCPQRCNKSARKITGSTFLAKPGNFAACKGCSLNCAAIFDSKDLCPLCRMTTSVHNSQMHAGENTPVGNRGLAKWEDRVYAAVKANNDL